MSLGHQTIALASCKYRDPATDPPETRGSSLCCSKRFRFSFPPERYWFFASGLICGNPGKNDVGIVLHVRQSALRAPNEKTPAARHSWPCPPGTPRYPERLNQGRREPSRAAGEVPARRCHSAQCTRGGTVLTASGWASWSRTRSRGRPPSSSGSCTRTAGSRSA